MYIFDNLKCPYINAQKAAEKQTPYYCELDCSEFYNMESHCKLCGVYDALLEKAREVLKEAGII